MKKKILNIIVFLLLCITIDVNAEEGWIEDNDNTYYYKNNIKLVGKQEIDGTIYYFDNEGIIQKGFVIDETTQKKYFFSYINGALKHGWQGLDGNSWYQDENGELLTGWQTIGNNRYYFDTEGYQEKGFKEIVDTEGYQEKGFKEIDNKKHFFSYIDGALKHGWQGLDGNYWYQNEEGELLKGAQTIEARDYIFNEETGFLDGFLYQNNNVYYYNPDGTQAKGIQYMTGQYWKFNEETGAFEKIVRQIRVIDISHHNGDIDWNKVKASGMVDAVILRLGYGDSWFDKKFFTNKAELERLGIPYSIYLFSYAENKQEALSESNFVINSIRENNIKIATNIFSIYYDLEDWEVKSTGENSYGISKDTYGEIITTFVDNIERNLCIKTRVYASEYYVYDRFPDYTYKYATWIANWTKKGITYPYNYEGWQYTSKADIPGIPWAWNNNTNQWEPHTDMSIFYY